MYGNLYSLFSSSYEIIKLEQNENFELAVSKEKWNNLCKTSSGNKKIMEAFQDNMKKEVRDAGPIFCESLNGKLLKFPETFEKFKEVNAFQIVTIRKKTLNKMAITVSAQSFSTTIERPYIKKFDVGLLELFDIEQARLLQPEKEVLNFISKAQKSYQTREDLCFILSTALEDNSTTNIFTNQMCNVYGDWWTVCEFEKPISISLSGLCTESPVDVIYSLVRPTEEKERFGTFVGTTGWVIQYSAGSQAWTIAHYAYRDKDLKLIDSNRRPFGKQTWLVKNNACNKGKDSAMKLLLSSCNDDQFTCDDGTCVAIEFRCDKKQDCIDLSDEKEC